MKPIDTVTPTLPPNWVRPVADKRRQRERDKPKDSGPRRPPGDDPGERTHIIDELA